MRAAEDAGAGRQVVTGPAPFADRSSGLRSEPPLFADPLFGLRFWSVLVDEDGEWLAGPHQQVAWPAGGEWLVASCPSGHAAPAADCDCGVHAWHPRRSSAREALAARATVAGIVEARGPAEVHEDGFRAERARPFALALTPRSNPSLIRRLAQRYDTKIVEVRGPDELLAWCRERGLGLDEDVVAALLGTGDAETRRRARRRRASRAALRVAAVITVSTLLVLGGLELIKDPPGERTLNGRTGEIQRP